MSHAMTPVGPAYTTSPLADTTLLIGRIALVAIYLMSGFQKFTDLGGVAGMLAAKGLPQPMILATLAAITEVGGALLIAVGLQTRLVAIGLLIFTAIATYFFHDFWNEPAGPEQANNMIHAMKNLSICGAFLMLAGIGAGRYSMDGRVR
ncbi:MAG TPA: DoxX family protein [Pseudolabrys sp.]|nr:DoxX family protein [Pseudolabrys sp.]